MADMTNTRGQKALGKCPLITISRIIIASSLIVGGQVRANDSLPLNRLEILLALDGFSVSKDEKGVAVFKRASLTGATGQPAIPVFNVKVLLPPNADMRTVKATLTNEVVAQIEGPFDVSPVPPAIGRGKVLWPEGVKFTDGRDVEAYAKDAYSPVTFLGLSLTSQMREWRLVEVDVRPFKYNPVKKQLLRLTNGSLVVTFERIPNLRPIKTRSPEMAAKFRNAVRSQAVNFENMAHEYEVSGK
jgi:hypothetical protein